MKPKRSDLLMALIIISTEIFAQSSLSLYRLETNIAGFTNANSRSIKIYVAGRGSEFKFTNITDKDYIVQFKKVVEVSDEEFDDFVAKYNNQRNQPDQIVKLGEENTGDLFTIIAADLLSWSYSFVRGVAWGPLSIPFRLSLSDGSVLSGGSIGLYGGCSFVLFGLKTTPLVSCSLSSIPTVNVNSAKIDTKWGITGAFGLVFNIVESFQLGLVFGLDHIGDSSWVYEDKLWGSLGVGYAFLK
jgi:hypothetical protein